MAEKVNLPSLGEPAPRRRQNDGDDSGAGFVQSAVSAGTRELFGLDARQEVNRFRAENPGAGIASQVVGQIPFFAAPFTRVGQAATRALPVFGRGVRSGERLQAAGRPAAGLAAKDTASVAAFETGRIGATAAIGGDVGEVAQEAAFEVALTGGASALVGHMARSMPPADRPSSFEVEVQRDLDGSYNLNSPPTVKMQDLSRIRENVTDQGILDEIDRHIATFGTQVRTQDLARQDRVVRKLDNVNDENRRLSGKLSSSFRSRQGKTIDVKKLTFSRTKGGFSSTRRAKNQPDTLFDFEQRAGLPKGWEKHSFHPRYNKVKTAEGARWYQKMLDEMSHSATAGGRQTWVTKEADDGAYVMVRRAREGSGRVEPGDEFTILKSDDPGFFAPELNQFERITNKGAFEVERGRRTGSESQIGQTVDQLEDSMPEVGVMSGEMASGSAANSMSRRITEALFGEEKVAEWRQGIGRSTDFVGRIGREFALPTLNRYGGKNGSARAAQISLTDKAIRDMGRFRATQILAGSLPKGYYSSMFKDIFRMNSPREGGIFQAVDALSDRAMPDISEAFRKNLSPEDMANAGMNREAQEFMSFLNKQDTDIIEEFNRTMRDIGHSEFEGMANHYMLSRMWEGRRRIPIKKKNGQIVAVASGKTAKEATDEAEKLTEIINKQDDFQKLGGVSFRKGDIKFADEGDDLNQVVDLGDRTSRQNINWLREARDPNRFQNRAGVQGFKGSREDLTHKDLRDILGRQVREMHDLMAERMSYARLYNARDKLKVEDRAFSRMLEAELKARSGQRGNWSKATEDAVDQILTPVFGTRASELVRATNNAIFQLTLGAGNVGFAALNAAQFMQTALPEISFLLHAAPDRIRPFYSSNIVKTPQGMRNISVLEPLKLVRQGFKDMSQPPDELWEVYKRARDEGRVSPVLAEEVLGPNSDLMRHFSAFFREHRTLPELMQELSTYMPARTEEMSRSMALSLGWRVGKDFMDLQGEELYQFATRFVDNTHFRYSASDRPQLMRGAFGSLLGLFKSWMLHYTGNMMRYSGEAVRRGNFGPLLWSQAGTMSLAGLSGSAALPLAEGMNSLMSDEPLVQNLYEQFGYSETENNNFVGSPADAMFYGLPAFLNLGLAHRAAVPGADVANDFEQLYTIMHYDRAVALGDLVGGSIDAAVASGQHPAKSQEVMDAFYRFALPRTAQSAMQNVGQRGTRSLNTQNRILSEMTWSEATISALGFQPNRLARTYDLMDIGFKNQQERQEDIAAFGELMAQAEMDNDPAEMQNLYIRSTYQGVPFDKIRASSDSRVAKRNEALIERLFDERKTQAVRRALGLE